MSERLYAQVEREKDQRRETKDQRRETKDVRSKGLKKLLDVPYGFVEEGIAVA